MFKTARFKVHNPSRHKEAMLLSAMNEYHNTLKRLLETVLALPDLDGQVSQPDRKGKQKPNRALLSKLLYTLAPKEWELALRDDLISNAADMLMSHLNKAYKGKNESNPPTVPALVPLTEDDFLTAYSELTNPQFEPELRPQQQEFIAAARAEGKTRVARRMERVFTNHAVSRAAGKVLREYDSPLPIPINFSRNEFRRGCLLSCCSGKYYLLIRLFTPTHRHYEKKVLQQGFINARTHEHIGGKTYPGLILPLELGRDHHEKEYLSHGTIKSAKLVVRRTENGHHDFYIHAAFEFTPDELQTETILGIDRGAVKIGAGTLIDMAGNRIEENIDLDGASFAREMAHHQQRTVELQRRGIRRSRCFSLRGKRAESILGEYANRVVEIATRHRAQIVLEAIQGTTMGRFLRQSQFTRLKMMLTYKAQREGLPEPIEVPAAFSSQTCSRCGHQDRANRPKTDSSGRAIQDVFLCGACGFNANADTNASEIVAFRGLHQIQQGGKYQTFQVFQLWLKDLKGQDGYTANGRCSQ